MKPAAHNVVQKLPQLLWRTKAVPCSDVSYSCSHTYAERAWPYRDGVGHEHTGRDSYIIRAKLHFINTIQSGDVPLYPDQWIDYRKLLSDGQGGRLRHPDIGTIYAVVKSWDVEINAQNTAGIVVNVEWSESREDAKLEGVLDDGSGAAALANQIDNVFATKNMILPSVEKLRKILDINRGIKNEGGFGDIFRTFSDATSSFTSARRFATTDIIGEVNQIAGSIDRVIDDVESLVLEPPRFDLRISALDRLNVTTLTTPQREKPTLTEYERASLRSQLIEYRVALLRSAEQAQQNTRPQSQVETGRELSVSELASLFNNSVTEIIELNPTLSRTPIIQIGTVVKYYTDK